jgi:hypothetical protein
MAAAVAQHAAESELFVAGELAAANRVGDLSLSATSFVAFPFLTISPSLYVPDA